MVRTYLLQTFIGSETVNKTSPEPLKLLEVVRTNVSVSVSVV